MPDDRRGERPKLGASGAEISTGTVQLFRKYTGRGPTRAHTSLVGDSVIVLLKGTLGFAEQSLIDQGHATHLMETRRLYQETMKAELVELVESNLDRKVKAFISAEHVDPDVAVELFVLEPSAS